MALDGNTQDFVAEICKGRTLVEAVAILKEELPERMTDILLTKYVTALPMDEKRELIRKARKRTSR